MKYARNYVQSGSVCHKFLGFNRKGTEGSEAPLPTSKRSTHFVTWAGILLSVRVASVRWLGKTLGTRPILLSTKRHHNFSRSLH